MIGIGFLNGLYADKVCWILDQDFDQMKFFKLMVKQKWLWELDYSFATEKEIKVFFRAELIARIVRALENGISVKFLNQSYRLDDNQDLDNVGQKIEDVIVSSRGKVFVESDNENGFIIGLE